ncbi:hypothetical protein CT154_11300 [Komagataeibacter xylinus]|nr:hypothetical protein CT154_11300 [Komagataeibacter xylinus]
MRGGADDGEDDRQLRAFPPRIWRHRTDRYIKEHARHHASMSRGGGAAYRRKKSKCMMSGDDMGFMYGPHGLGARKP